MAKHTNLSSLFTAIADAIRDKNGLAAGTKIVADNFPDEIAGITTGITPSGKIDITSNGEHDVTNYAKANVNVSSTIPSNYADVSKVTATKADVLSTAKFVDKNGTLSNGSITNGALSSTMTFDVDDSTGIVTATASVKTSGYLASGKSTSDTEQLDTNSGGIWTPSATTARSISKGTFLTGELTLAKEPNLIASNIKKGVSIYGVSGSMSTISEYTKVYQKTAVTADMYCGDCFEFSFVPDCDFDPSLEKLVSLIIYNDYQTLNNQISTFVYNGVLDVLSVSYMNKNGYHKTDHYTSTDRGDTTAYLKFMDGGIIVGVYTPSSGNYPFAGYDSWGDNQSAYHIVAVFGKLDILN